MFLGLAYIVSRIATRGFLLRKLVLGKHRLGLQENHRKSVRIDAMAMDMVGQMSL